MSEQLKPCPIQFRKKPIVIEAFKFYGPFLADDVPQWFTQAVHDLKVILRGDRKTDHVEIRTLEGIMIARKGDWIIKGVKGEMYPCKPDIFEETYEDAEITRTPDVEKLQPSFHNDIIEWTEILRKTHKFPMAGRPTDWFLDQIIEKLKSTPDVEDLKSRITDLERLVDLQLQDKKELVIALKNIASTAQAASQYDPEQFCEVAFDMAHAALKLEGIE